VHPPAPRALVVDDDAGIRVLVTRILTREGYAVESARDGGEAIEKLLQHEFELIALDLMMPRIDGIAVVRYLAENHPEKLANVLVMTAFGPTALPKVCPPVARYIEKPFDIHAFLAQAAECLGRRENETTEASLSPDRPPSPVRDR
jgi:CheY-like chemotaxis protein